MRRVTVTLLALPATAVLALTGCATQSSGGGNANAASGGGNACTPAKLQTKTAGTLTFGADQPVYPPWYENNNPTNGKGFEDAVAYAVAKQLGYSPAKVAWTRVTFNAAIQPGPKKFDLDLDEFSITKQREQEVDFSSPYYTVTQAVVALKNSKAAKATSIADLRKLELGSQVGTTSLNAITNQIKPTQQPKVFQTYNGAKTALEAGEIDGIVVDLPTAFYITAAQIKNSVIVGQLPPYGSHPEQFGILLDKGSPLTGCVSKAVNALRSNGTLQQIQSKWLAQDAGAPVLH